MSRLALRFTLVGTSPLLMHSGSLLDPIHPVSLELAAYHGKAVKTAADHARIGELEFVGALWLSDDRPCVPARTLAAAIKQAAEHRGASDRIRGALTVEGDMPLDYPGPPTVDGLKENPFFRTRSPTICAGRRTVRTRPVFRDWALPVDLRYDPSVLGRGDVVDLVTFAGDEIGIGAGRPRFGRFCVTPA